MMLVQEMERRKKKKAERAQWQRQTADLFTSLTAHFAEPFCKIHLFLSEHFRNQTEPD